MKNTCPAAVFDSQPNVEWLWLDAEERRNLPLPQPSNSITSYALQCYERSLKMKMTNWKI